MNNKSIVILVFLLVAMAQIAIPAKLILDKENLLESGLKYKFEIYPVNFNYSYIDDYLTLIFKESKICVSNEKEWVNGETVYVVFSTDKDGFVKIKSISKSIPINNIPFVKAKVNFVTMDGSKILSLSYSFNRYYFDMINFSDVENKIKKYDKGVRNVCYAVVCVKEGEAVLKDVIFNSISLNSIFKKD